MKLKVLLILAGAAVLGVAIMVVSSLAPLRPNELRMVIFDDVKTLDPQKMSWNTDIRTAECLFEPLVRFKLPELTIEPGVAEAWEKSPDGLTYTFHLRASAKWSNGDPVTAGDFLYAWRRAILPDSAADYTQLFYCLKGAEEFFNWRQQQLGDYAKSGGGGHSQAAAKDLWNAAQDRFTKTVGLSAPDSRTLVATLARPTPYFLELCAFATFMPVHHKTMEAAASLDADSGMVSEDPRWTQPGRIIGNGPYTLKTWKPDNYMLMEANDRYWNRAAMRNAAIRQYHLEQSAALTKFQDGGVDWLPDIPTADASAAEVIKSYGPKAHLYNAAGTYFYNFNCQPRLKDGSPNPLADPRVRRALSMAIDRQTLVDKVTQLHQIVARTFTPPGSIPGYEPPIEAGVTYNVEEARKLLAEAGYPGGKGLTGLSILYNPEGSHQTIAQQIKNTWEKDLGVVVTLETVNRSVFGDRLKSHDYTISRAGWYGDYRDPTTFLDKFVTGNGNNDGAYSNPKFDELMDKARNEADPAKRMTILRDAETLMLQEQPAAFLFQYCTLEVYDDKTVSGLYPNPWGRRRLELVELHRGKK